MKNLILYASKNHTTEETVLRIKAHADHPLDIHKISEAGNLDLSGYSHIYIGTGIYGGKLPGSVTGYVKKNKERLRTKPVTFFIHGLDSKESYSGIVNQGVSRYLENKHYETLYLGGKLDISSQNFFIRMILVEIAKKNHFDPHMADTRREDAILALIKRF
ncbi:flavodoxin domain-containing protein [Lacrimispora sp. JR3]|uniref:flavodoxin domain-containing protein n=1 Tax=Lacrimispora sinapis TaxID=3111456 RepID=UPI00374A9529